MAKRPTTAPTEAPQAPDPTPTAAPTEAPTADVFTYADLKAKIAQHAAAKGLKVDEIDPAIFIKEHSLPNPKHLARVTWKNKDGKDESFQTYCDDESDAKAQAITAHRLQSAPRLRVTLLD